MADSSADGREPIEVLAQEFLERRRRGETPSLNEYVQRFPDLADEIRELFPTLAVMHAIDPAPGEPSASRAAPAAPAPGHLRDYRILRTLGHGGMGVVYEAEQISLGRRVALKILSAQTVGDDRARERFRREARAAARLHHTNIVPVFDIGQEGTVCYYAMQLIPGQSLDRVIEELRRLRAESGGPTPGPTAPDTPAGPPAGAVGTPDTPGGAASSLLTGVFARRARGSGPRTDGGPGGGTPSPASGSGPGCRVPGLSSTTAGHPPYYRSVACVGQQAAQALAYAHARGVVHRDVKPSNLLLDEAGVVWVTDFGLAKTDDDELTRTGELPGTLRYMSPERFQGHCDARADVYALGLTLYELLVLEPAFAASDRLHLLEQIRHRDPPRPRARDRGVPRDLETVVLKAIEKDPRRRYRSAAELAEDLRRFLADEPVRARRVRPAERVGLWCRRNPVLATLAVSVALLLLMVAVGGVVLSLRLREALKQAEGQRDKAEGAERGRREQLLEALLAEARAKRYSGRVGQRFGTLAAVREATALAHDLGKPPAAFDELRDLAAAALALPDLRDQAWDIFPEGSVGLDFDPVGLRLYARSDDQGDVTVRRLEDDGEVARLPGAGKRRRVIFGADGRRLLLHDAASGALEQWVIGGPAPVRVATVSPDVARWQQSRDGRRLLAFHQSASGNRVEVIDLPSGRRRYEHAWPEPGDWRAAWCVSLSPDGRRLALVDGAYLSPQRQLVSLIDLDTGRQAGELRNPGRVFAPSWHPDSRTLAVGDWNSNAIYVWDAPSGKLLHTLDEQKGGEPFLEMSLSGQLLASLSSWAGGQVFWHPHTGKVLLRTPFSYNVTYTVQDGRLYTYDIDRPRIILHILEPSPVFRALVPDPADQPLRDCRGVAVHPGGRLLAVGHSNGVSLFDLATGLEVGRLDLGWNLFAQFDPSDGALLTYGPRGLFRWPVRLAVDETKESVVGPPLRIGPGGGNDTQFDVSRDGKVIAVADYAQAIVYRQEDDGWRAVRLAPVTDVRCVRLSPDGRWALTTSHAVNEFLAWDARTGRRVAAVGNKDCSFSRDGRWLSDGRRRWQVGTWQEGPATPVAAGPLALAFSPDGTLFAGQANNEVEAGLYLVSTASGKALVHLGLPEQSRTMHAAFSPGGAQLVQQSLDYRYVYAWDLCALRRHLAALGLDWDAPPYTDAAGGAQGPLAVRVVGVERTAP